MEGMGIVYLSLLIPLVTTFCFYLYKKHEFTWWEFFVPILSTLVIIFVTVKIAEHSSTNFTEYWGETVVSVYESEPYNEWISKQCSNTTTDSKGNSTTTYYDCSYQDDTPPSWTATTNLGTDIRISEPFHDKLVGQFGTAKTVIKTRRNHSPNDRASGSSGTKFAGTRVGRTSNVYRTNWGNDDETRQAYTSKHKYKNKIKASDLTVFNMSIVSHDEADTLGLFDIPDYKGSGWFSGGNGFDFPTILGAEVNEEIHEKFRRLNAKYGESNQMRLWILVFEDEEEMIAHMQENYWVRGNMNELTICIGVNGEEIEWAYAFSWATSNTLTVEVADAVRNLYTYKDDVKQNNTVLPIPVSNELKKNLGEVGEKLPPVIPVPIQTNGSTTVNKIKSKTPVLTNETWVDLYEYLDGNLGGFERRDIEEEFDYVKVVPSKTAKIIIYILAFLISIGTNIWVVRNNIYEGSH